MIDWAMVGYSALWISGLSVILAAVSYADYVAHAERNKLRRVFRRPGFQAVFNLGLLLVCLGLIGSSRASWEQVVWGVLAVAFAVHAWQALRSWRWE